MSRMRSSVLPIQKAQKLAEASVQLGERCPHCGGTGRQRPSETPAGPLGPAAWRVVGGPGFMVPGRSNGGLPGADVHHDGGSFWMNGTMVRLRVGDVVRLVAYGRDGIQRMRDRGIILEPVE